MNPTIYRGFMITPVFIYGNGKIDFEFYKIDNEEVAARVRAGTLEQVKANIDNYEDDNTAHGN